MALQHILDSHMHLFPPLFPGMAPMNSIADYKTTISRAQSPKYQVDGFIWIETDARSRPGTTIEQWASGPLDELKYLKGIVEGAPTGSQITINSIGNGDMMKGIVPWAPIDRGLQAFLEYLKVAEKIAGKETWSKVKGFRYLLQGIRNEQKFRSLVEDPKVVEVLQHFGNSYTFDVGVDQHHGGVWQLERVAGLIDAVSNSSKTRFVLGKFQICHHLLAYSPDFDINSHVLLSELSLTSPKTISASQTLNKFPPLQNKRKISPGGR
jgi:L-rhamnono-1,4-lactonase